MYGRVVVPLDGSDLAEGVFSHLEDVTTTESIIFPVMVVGPMMYGGVFGAANWDYQLHKESHQGALYYLRTAMESHGWGDVPLQCIVKRHATVAEAIVETAVEQTADLIVMNSRGRTGLSRFILGSVAQEVLKLSPIEVKVFVGGELAVAS
jgi:nucleotide-binding universal stress UspA family protein